MGRRGEEGGRVLWDATTMHRDEPRPVWTRSRRAKIRVARMSPLSYHLGYLQIEGEEELSFRSEEPNQFTANARLAKTAHRTDTGSSGCDQAHMRTPQSVSGLGFRV